MELWLEKAPELVVKTVEHLVLTGVSTTVAVLVGLPLGVWIRKNARLRGIVLGLAGVLQIIPSLAMLAFLLPFLGIGLTPALVALTLYAILPIVRNTYTGLNEISPEIIEAADGLGFTSGQRLMQVEMPLALPVIVAGIRTAAVIGVGIATLSAFIGAGGLGDFINRGLALNSNRLILLGAVPAAFLALLLDFAIGLIEALLRPGKTTTSMKYRAVVVFCIVVVLGIVGFLVSHGDQGTQEDTTDTRPPLRIGTKNFTEQLILGELMARRIESTSGIEVDRRFNLGGSILCHRALVNGEIDLYPEYTGTALTAILGQEKIADPQECFEAVSRAYRNRFACEWFDPFGFNSTYTITVRSADADKFGWETISDLEGEASSLKAGFTAEFSERPDGYPGLRNTYGFGFDKAFDLDPGLMYKSVAQGEVDVICAFSTDGRIEAYDLIVLRDDRRFFPPYYASPVVRLSTLRMYPELKGILEPLAGLISDEVMQRLNFEVDEKGRSPGAVAKDFLRDRLSSSGDSETPVQEQASGRPTPCRKGFAATPDG